MLGAQGDSHRKKNRGVLAGNFEKGPIEVPSHIIWVSSLKGITKATTVDPLRLDTLRVTKTTFNPLKV